MSIDYLIFLSVPGLRIRDIERSTTPTLYEWADGGAMAELAPTFPCVTSPVQASMATGTPPGDHGVIANGFYDRARREVEFWVARNSVIEGEQIWDSLRTFRPDMTSAGWHLQNIKGANADFIVTPAPIHEPDGTTKLWCYSQPDELYPQLLEAMDHFPLQHYWGPLANIESTRWILSAAAWLVERHAPHFHWIYIPHLDYAAQKFGPNSQEAHDALVELDQVLQEFRDRVARSAIASDVMYMVAGEYALTEVRGAVPLNRILRRAGLLSVREEEGVEWLDLSQSRAFAMVDHQLAHIYVNDRDPSTVAQCREVLEGVPDIAGVYSGDSRCDLGIRHGRSGDVVVLSDDAHWFSYYWWLDDAAAPPFARTVDIHRKPGYDPAELFLDPTTRSVPLDASLVKGSHGVPATGPQHRTALLCSRPSSVIREGSIYRDTDIMRIVHSLLGVPLPRTG